MLRMASMATVVAEGVVPPNVGQEVGDVIDGPRRGDGMATVRFAASISSVLGGVPVSCAIAAAEMVTGRRVAVALFAVGDQRMRWW